VLMGAEEVELRMTKWGKSMTLTDIGTGVL
jgi:hypothetical protein